MAKSASRAKRRPTRGAEGITAVSVSGFKSIGPEQTVELRPLTLLAGANSSGKSSIMQPLLLIKQTLEAPFDPGPLLIDGPNVRFTSADQFLSTRGPAGVLTIGMRRAKDAPLTLVFNKVKRKAMRLSEMRYGGLASSVSLRQGMSSGQILDAIPWLRQIDKTIARETESSVPGRARSKWAVQRDRCFLFPAFRATHRHKSMALRFPDSVAGPLAAALRGLIHLPGLRGNPQRSYPKTAVGPTFPGLFQDYVASVIAKWEADSDHRLGRVGTALRLLDLTWKVKAKSIDDTQFQLRVGRLRKAAQGGAKDLVDIADVGFGVSQVLPVLVALEVARPGQIVYIEQPEIHLHPRAQHAMAQVLAGAAKRGVRVVAETHSALLLLGVQSAVAKGQLDPAKVILHWFERDSKGHTKITSANLDASGAFGEKWPEDFAETELRAQSEYLDATEANHRGD